ncbi:uncharacterized protein B0H18DRAFT_1039745 [Fomitopsis serialis]|uniref:uncharacterized protein n=1 Tax=Fomitopsis serialis TaxID=139415 RepID=UPI002008A62B|nr:uncharacterized protein B0H18DRAFT_1039745 [Neoantrodia serialis]KAH9915917.1 hypothetical protein B0H18DRAFT_1039745 [Neoantrodia serialis]
MKGHIRPHPYPSDISPDAVPIRTFFVPVAHLPRTTTSPSRSTLLAAVFPLKSVAMSRLAMPTALAADALSPLEIPSVPWDAHLQPTGMLYSPAARAAHAQALASFYATAPSPPHSVSSSGTRPASPIAAASLLRSRVPSPAAATEQTLCLPTHQLLTSRPVGSHRAVARQESQERERLSISINPSLAVPAKRASSTAPSASSSKKPRASTKREARLVKNRAAAFLSRQRKREEFETWRCDRPHAQQPLQEEELLSEVEQLRRQLAEIQERERALAEELSRKQRSPSPAPSSTSSPQLSLRSTRMDRSGASLGLMVSPRAIEVKGV